MSDTIDLGGELTPEENSYFESGGESTIPTGEKPAGEGEGEQPNTEKTTEGEQPKVEKMVSLSALHEERARRREIDTKFRATEKELAELRGKFSIVEKLNIPQQQEVKAPTVEEDIFGVVKNTTDTVAEIQKRLKADDESRKAQGERDSLVNAYRMDANQFEAKNPDFKAAYSHLLNSRAAELQAMGYDDPAQLHEALTNDEMSIAKMALGNKKSAAEIIYNLAQQRGYKKAAPKTETGADKIDTINKGQNANKSLSNTGGSSGDGDVTAEMLLKMEMPDFEAWCVKNPAKAKRLMGG